MSNYLKTHQKTAEKWEQLKTPVDVSADIDGRWQLTNLPRLTTATTTTLIPLKLFVKLAAAISYLQRPGTPTTDRSPSNWKMHLKTSYAVHLWSRVVTSEAETRQMQWKKRRRSSNWCNFNSQSSLAFFFWLTESCSHNRKFTYTSHYKRKYFFWPPLLFKLPKK